MSGASHCCAELGCSRMQPMAVYLGDFSSNVYVVTRYQLHAEPNLYAAIERHDITDAMRSFLHRNRDWVLAELGEDLDLA